VTYRSRRAKHVFAAAWSPDGACIASGIGKAVEVWDVRTGQTRCIYQEHQDFLTSVAWSPDGQQVASGARDRTVQVWQP
jgi:WD40 repeat protein